MNLMDLQDQLIRLGNANPELRENLKPVIAMVTATMDDTPAARAYRTVQREIMNLHTPSRRQRVPDVMVVAPDKIKAVYHRAPSSEYDDLPSSLSFLPGTLQDNEDAKALRHALKRRGVPVAYLDLSSSKRNPTEVTVHIALQDNRRASLEHSGSRELTADAFGQIRQLAGQLRAGGSKFIDAVMTQDPKKMRQQAYLITFAMGVLFSALDMPNEAAMLKRVAAQLR